MKKASKLFQSTRHLKAMWRFRRARDGVAAVEFAIVLPLMVLVYVGSNEISQAMMANRGATISARTLADLISQQQNNVSIQDSDLVQAFSAAAATMSPFPSSSLAMTLTSIEFTSNPASPYGYDAKPRWTATQNGGTPRPCQVLTPSSNTASPSTTTMPQGLYGSASMIVADVAYSYSGALFVTRLTQLGAPQLLQFSRTAYMRPRNWISTSPAYIPYAGSTFTVCPSY
jgi:Flp pilus assembly protein TadG